MRCFHRSACPHVIDREPGCLRLRSQATWAKYLRTPAYGATLGLSMLVELRAPREVNWRQPLPGSKSLTNRALLLAALARGTSRLRGWLDADDTRHMRAALAQLGSSVVEHGDGALEVSGWAGVPTEASREPIFVGTSGTVSRFLLPVLAACPAATTMDGTARMRERPMKLLIDALCEQGASIRALGQPGFLPLEIKPSAGLRGGEIRIGRPASSQFVSGLVLGAALASETTDVVLSEGTPARPYVDMTLACLCAFGGDAKWVAPDRIRVCPRPLQARDYVIEPDASAASYPLALSAIYGGSTVIADLGTASLQGDVAFARVLEQLGARVTQSADRTELVGTQQLRGGEFDMSQMPDMTLTLAVTALFAEGPTSIDGVEILRHHESDRLAAGATELRKLGATVQEREGGLTITPPREGIRRRVEIDTYDDHRMAMAFSLAGDVRIRDAACVAKTYPEYFNHLEKLGMVVGER